MLHYANLSFILHSILKLSYPVWFQSQRTNIFRYEVLYLFSPPVSDSLLKRTYVLAQMFFLFYLQREIFEMRGPTGVKFCTMVSTRPYFVIPVQNFAGHTPKKFQGRKTCKIWPDFGRLRSSAANISETDKDIQNR